MLVWRSLWKDWGFAPTLFGQAQQFAALAKDKPADTVREIEKQFAKRIGITDALRKWPKLLTGSALDPTSPSYSDCLNAIQYRNCLVHGQITAKIASLGKLAQDLETIPYAEAVLGTVADMVKMTATHFGFNVPAWV